MLRAQQIIIDIPNKGQEPWITVVLQDVKEDAAGNVVQTVNRVGMIHRPLSKVAKEIVVHDDPIANTKNVRTSVLGLSLAIRSAVLKWIDEDYAGY